MGCAEYQERINELALAAESAVPETTLARHLVICAKCREELAARRALVERIDLGVAAMVAVDVPQSLAARVRQQIATEETKPGSILGAYRWAWFAGAGVAIAAAILLAIALRPAGRGNTPAESSAAIRATATAPTEAAHPEKLSTEAAPTIVPPAVPLVSRANAARLATTSPPPVERDAIANAIMVAEADAPTLDVMIPANQRFGVRQFLYAARHDQVDEAMISKPGEAVPLEPLELKPLKIDLIAPADGQQSNSGSGRN